MKTEKKGRRGIMSKYTLGCHNTYYPEVPEDYDFSTVIVELLDRIVGRRGERVRSLWTNMPDVRIIPSNERFAYPEVEGWSVGGTRTDDCKMYLTMERKVNQLERLIENVRTNPLSMRHVVLCWNLQYLEHLPEDTFFEVDMLPLEPWARTFVYMRTRKKTDKTGFGLLDNYVSDMAKAATTGKKPDFDFDKWKIDVNTALDGIGFPKYQMDMFLHTERLTSWEKNAEMVNLYWVLLKLLSHLTNSYPGTLLHSGSDLESIKDILEDLTKGKPGVKTKGIDLEINPDLKELADLKASDFTIVEIGDDRIAETQQVEYE